MLRKLALIVVSTKVSANVFSKIGTSNGYVEDYGCWCYFGENYGIGKGLPVDEMDGLCKRLANAYECAMMDYAEANDGNDDCVPWEVQYIAGNESGRHRDGHAGIDNLKGGV